MPNAGLSTCFGCSEAFCNISCIFYATLEQFAPAVIFLDFIEANESRLLAFNKHICESHFFYSISIRRARCFNVINEFC